MLLAIANPFEITSSPASRRSILPLPVDSPNSVKAPFPTTNRSGVADADRRSPLETRVSLVLAVASQAASASQRLVSELVAETGKYVLPRRFESRNLEEALMAVPDLETVRFRVLARQDEYEIHLVENITSEKMEMTTPVYTHSIQTEEVKMEMTTPVITKRSEHQEKWQMSFVMPSKYGAKLPVPKDPSVRIREIPGKIVAVAAFSGFVSDEEVRRREARLREALKRDLEYQVKEVASVEVAQFNPPFTLPFMRRNEIELEVELRNG